ncbi:MAG TPA: hypothetical protein VFW05_09115 [Verrucomicrobiae bacterium]|nr:hypothetical protein [Verrucomicrobiae bacterium]
MGELIGLQCTIGDSDNGMEFEWTVPGYAVGGYSASVNAGILNTNIVTTNSYVSFYWVDGGTKSVSCKVKYKGQELSGATTFEVKRPAAQLSAVTTTNQPTVDVIPASLYGKTLSNYYFTFGSTHDASGSSLSNSYGIQFFGQVTTPSDCSGTLAFISVVTSTLRAYTTNDGTHWKWDSHGTNYVDAVIGEFLYAKTIIGSSEVKEIYDADTPGSMLYCACKSLEVDDHFKTYLMFQPANGIWVPLRSVVWYWNGNATNDIAPQCSWIRKNSDSSENPASVNELLFPTWNNQIRNLIASPPEPDL